MKQSDCGSCIVPPAVLAVGLEIGAQGKSIVAFFYLENSSDGARRFQWKSVQRLAGRAALPMAAGARRQKLGADDDAAGPR